MNAPEWPQEDIEHVSQLWEAGKTGGQISLMLKGKYSSEAISAKMRRIGCMHPPKAKRPDPQMFERDVLSRHRNGIKPGDIARTYGLRVSEVTGILTNNGLDPREHVHPSYSVHPMWSMPEEERRMAFYEKFKAGWAEVQERLEADHKERLNAR